MRREKEEEAEGKYEGSTAGVLIKHDLLKIILYAMTGGDQKRMQGDH